MTSYHRQYYRRHHICILRNEKHVEVTVTKCSIQVCKFIIMSSCHTLLLDGAVTSWQMLSTFILLSSFPIVSYLTIVSFRIDIKPQTENDLFLSAANNTPSSNSAAPNNPTAPSSKEKNETKF